MATIQYKHPAYFNVDELLTDEHKLVRDCVRDWVNKRVKPIIDEACHKHEFPAHLTKELSEVNKQIKGSEKELDEKLYAKYSKLTEPEVKQLVVDNKWIYIIETAIKGEIDYISQRLTNRIKELAERYENTLGEIRLELSEAEAKVNAHLEKMGFVYEK